MDPYDAVVHHLLALPEMPTIVFVGPPCRTWFVDNLRLRALMADLYEIRPYDVVHGGRGPFDTWVERYAKELGISTYLVGPADPAIRFSVQYSRDPELAVGSALLVAFPMEDADWDTAKGPKRYPPESADIDVVRTAINNGVPVLGLYRSGWATWTK